jgi:hypothetical protein
MGIFAKTTLKKITICNRFLTHIIWPCSLRRPRGRLKIAIFFDENSVLIMPFSARADRSSRVQKGSSRVLTDASRRVVESVQLLQEARETYSGDPPKYSVGTKVKKVRKIRKRQRNKYLHLHLFGLFSVLRGPWLLLWQSHI